MGASHRPVDTALTVYINSNIVAKAHAVAHVQPSDWAINTVVGLALHFARPCPHHMSHHIICITMVAHWTAHLVSNCIFMGSLKSAMLAITLHGPTNASNEKKSSTEKAAACVTQWRPTLVLNNFPS